MNARKATIVVETKCRESQEALSPLICWTRMQAEAGQDIGAIVQRKELERKAGDGTFCWGVGNAPPRKIGELAKHGDDVDVIFSIMKSRPKEGDIRPAGLVVWRSFFGVDGIERSLPPNVLVTSSLKSSGRSHYALMCRADRELALSDLGAFDPRAYRNVSEAGRPVGASQVTALLRRVGTEADAATYRVNLQAKLVKSYWVKLGDPWMLSDRKRSELMDVLANVGSFTAADWLEAILGIKGQTERRRKRAGMQLSLFAA